MNKSFIALGALCTLSAGVSFGGIAEDLTVPCVYTNALGKTFNYRWSEPSLVEAEKTYPLVIFLHGAGERGTNNVDQLKHGCNPLFAYCRARTNEIYFIAGQVPKGEQWVNTPWANTSHRMSEKPSDSMELLMELVDRTCAKCRVDRSRVYVTGISMGGYGTWDYVQRRPDLFAAALPICGGGDTHLAWKIRDVPIWTWHGDRDTTVPYSRSREMVSSLWAVDAKIRYTEVPGCGHGCWGPAYDNETTFDWLFKQRKPNN